MALIWSFHKNMIALNLLQTTSIYWSSAFLTEFMFVDHLSFFFFFFFKFISNIDSSSSIDGGITVNTWFDQILAILFYSFHCYYGFILKFFVGFFLHRIRFFCDLTDSPFKQFLNWCLVQMHRIVFNFSIFQWNSPTTWKRVCLYTCVLSCPCNSTFF